MRGRGGPICARLESHEGPHCPHGREDCSGRHDTALPRAEMCPGSAARKNAQRTRDNAKRIASDSVCTVKGCQGIAARGRLICIECDRERSAKRRATETPCPMKGCQGVAPVGDIICGECRRIYSNKRRDLEENANYTDLRYVDNDVCYICGQQSAKLDIEHVIPLSKWRTAVAEDGVTESAWRAGCPSCNRGAGGKGSADHSVYLMRRFRAGQPVRQALGTCQGCPILAVAPTGFSAPFRHIPAPGHGVIRRMVA